MRSGQAVVFSRTVPPRQPDATSRNENSFHTVFNVLLMLFQSQLKSLTGVCMPRWSALKVLAFCFVSFAGTGCSKDALQRQEVTGMITYKGKPVPVGKIEFYPVSDGGSKHGESASIKDGVYTIPKDKGLPPGKYTVRINAPDRVTEAVGAPGSDMGPPPKELLPKQYNEESKLSATIEVKKEPNQADFKLD
jgi:hypothetical protein